MPFRSQLFYPLASCFVSFVFCLFNFVFRSFEFVSNFGLRYSELQIVRFEQFVQGVQKSGPKSAHCRSLLPNFYQFLRIFAHFLLIFLTFSEPTCVFDAKTCVNNRNFGPPTLPWLPILAHQRHGIGKLAHQNIHFCVKSPASFSPWTFYEQPPSSFDSKVPNLLFEKALAQHATCVAATATVGRHHKIVGTW